MSTNGDKCAYFDGSAYLLGVRFFLGRGEDVDVASSRAVSAGLVRFTTRCDRIGALVSLFGNFEVSEYWYLLKWCLNDGSAGEAAASSDDACSVFVERVRGIFGGE
jgi:hypothetical protein